MRPINAEIVMHTHAWTIVEKFIGHNLSLMHAGRRALLGAAVAAVMAGHLLSLSRLARALIGQGTLKAALKRIDRLIGNERIEREAQLVAAALLRMLCARGQPLVIAVDWSAVAPDGAFVELRAVATHAGMGRGLTVYQQVYAKAKLGNPDAERSLLRALHTWVPSAVPVIVITDAGFRRPWFAEVERFGWSWIGRVRAGVGVSRDRQHWQHSEQWFAEATGKACRWSNCWLSKRHRFACEFVLYRGRLIGAKRYGRAGHCSKPKASAEASARAREPWLLAHSPQLCTLRPNEIVALYRNRMQIEENFRDSKSIALGIGLEVSQSRSSSRLHALLVIGTLAAFLLWHIGQLAEAEGLHRRFKATTRKPREISIITLAKYLWLLPQLPLSESAMQALHDRLGLRA